MVWKVSVVKHCVLHDTLVVGPWCIRRNSIHPSAWKGYSQKFAICRGLGKPSVPWKFTEDSSSLVTVWAGWVYLLRAAPSPFPSRSWESPGPTLPLCLYSPGCLEVVFWELLRVETVRKACEACGTWPFRGLSAPNITAERSANRSSRSRDRGTPDGCPHAARSAPSGA